MQLFLRTKKKEAILESSDKSSYKLCEMIHIFIYIYSERCDIRSDEAISAIVTFA